MISICSFNTFLAAASIKRLAAAVIRTCGRQGSTVEPPIADPPTRGQPLYKGLAMARIENHYLSTQKQPPTSGPS